jgi:hypothetical protein
LTSRGFPKIISLMSESPVEVRTDPTRGARWD